VQVGVQVQLRVRVQLHQQPLEPLEKLELESSLAQLAMEMQQVDPEAEALAKQEGSRAWEPYATWERAPRHLPNQRDSAPASRGPQPMGVAHHNSLQNRTL